MFMSKKEIAINFLKLASSGKVAEAYEKYVHLKFRHHNAYFKSGREALLVGMEESAKTFPNKTYQVLRALEDGDLVAVHARVKLSLESEWSVIHIFRFEDGLIVEEWEASQEVVRNSPNECGVF